MAVTANTGLTLLDSAQSQKDVTANQAFTDLDQGLGMLAYSAAAGGALSLSTDQAQNGVVVVTGAPASAATISAPTHAAVGKFILFVSEATGSNKVVTVKKSGGSSFSLPASTGVVLLLSDTRAVTLLTPTREIPAAAEVGFSITAAPSQSADLMQWFTSTPTKVLSVAAAGHLTFGEGINLVAGTSTGTKIGTSASQKLGFFNVTPVVQPSAFTQTYSTASKTHANFTSSDLTGISSSTTGSALAEPSAAYTQSEMQQNFRRIQDQFNALRADVANVKQVLNAAIDDDQSLGLKS